MRPTDHTWKRSAPAEYGTRYAPRTEATMRRAKVIVRVRRKRTIYRALLGLVICAVLIMVVVWRLHPLLVSLVHSL